MEALPYLLVIMMIFGPSMVADAIRRENEPETPPGPVAKFFGYSLAGCLLLGVLWVLFRAAVWFWGVFGEFILAFAGGMAAILLISGVMLGGVLFFGCLGAAGLELLERFRKSPPVAPRPPATPPSPAVVSIRRNPPGSPRHGSPSTFRK